ncbi:MAG: type IV secretion protein IcmB [Micavibrio aeruginosavorus]|uniref:Type IV secretion protein IcmB n=1 Tax=Micavibrio aeruginosavorus TaxID=349221 RepID=A0A2W5FIH3_9BACT|nr:MAG: type IV secretion protein IcmB [Micavibrio aeruginosavorus]
MSFFEKLLAPFQSALRQSVESFIRLETMDDEFTLAAQDGSLVSYLKIDGSRQIIGDEEYRFLVEASTVKIGAKFDRQGQALQVYFVRDPARVKANLDKLINPSRTTANNVDLDVEDLLQERIKNLSSILTFEECYFVLWTRPSSMTKSELQRAAKDKQAQNKKWVNAGYGQNPLAGLEPLRTRHKSFVSSMLASLNELGMRAELLEAHDALRAVKNNLFPNKIADDWKASLPGDPIKPRAPMSRVDLSDIVWPPLRTQLSSADAQTVDGSVVRIGDMLWAGADMTLGPMEASPFPMLLNRLYDAKVPYRISFMIEGGGAYSTSFKSFVATIMSVTNALNRQIKYSLENLQTIARSEPVVRMRVSFATWGNKDEYDLVRDRLSTLIQSVESWGYAQVSEVSGDPLDCVMASAMGIHCAGTAPAAIAPMREVMKLIPWQRPSSPFNTGSILLRTPDGKVWPYQTGSNLTTTWFDLIFAQPGAGKSVLMNALNLGTVLSPGLNKLPYVAVIDIGPSSSGLISLIKEALPENRQHEAAYYRLQMSREYAINPFDTQLGCRAPLIDERSYLVELLILLCTPPGHDKPYDGIQQLAGLVVDEMYRWRDDRAANAEPRPYLPRLDANIDEAIVKYGIHLPADPYWWDVVDRMFEIGQYRIANLAQRHAVPSLSDAITASRRPQIRTLLEETSVGFSTESVISAFERMITSAIREYPIMSSVTQFEITDARVCSLDLMDVSPQGDDTADRQTSIMYMLARYALVRSWWVGPEALPSIPEKYRHYHEMRLQDVAETPKRLCYDEFHRTSKSHSVRAQVIRDVREGRKRGVQIVLASQLLDDFDKDMVDLATGVWVLGTAVSDKAVDEIKERFGLSDTARNVIRYRLTGPRAGGAPALLILGTNEGRYEQHLINTMGPIELWAVSTSSEDVSIRNRLYGRIGAGRARQMLASTFPGGSARNEIKRRIMMRASSGEARNAATSAVVEEIVEELAQAAVKRFSETGEA